MMDPSVPLMMCALPMVCVWEPVSSVLLVVSVLPMAHVLASMSMPLILIAVCFFSFHYFVLFLLFCGY